jgi:ABC-type dipeptide/oligopeptide/nickel transport system ATPase component
MDDLSRYYPIAGTETINGVFYSFDFLSRSIGTLHYSENHEPLKVVSLSGTSNDFQAWLKERAGEISKGKLDEQVPLSDVCYARALEILRFGDPIGFILDTFNTQHVGDRDVGEGLLLGTASQSVLNSLGIPSKLTGDSGKGKSHAARAIMHLHPQEYVVYASLTDKAIWYHPNIRTGATIFSDDVSISPELEGIIKRATSNFQRETMRIVPQKENGKYVGVTQTIPARINWLLTSVRTQGSDELIKRQMGYDVDTSDSQDKAYIDFERQRAAKAIEEFPMSEDVLTCREIIKFLKETEDGEPRIVGVDIPFNERIVWTDTENRRNFNIFMDMIRAFAVFRFMQRELSENGSIIATIDDFNDAKRHYSARAGLQALHLDETQKRFCQHLAQLGGAILRLCRRK